MSDISGGNYPTKIRGPVHAHAAVWPLCAHFFCATQYVRLDDTVYGTLRERAALDEGKLIEAPLHFPHVTRARRVRNLARHGHMQAEGLEIRTKTGRGGLIRKD